MVRLTLNKDYDPGQLETGSLCLGFKEIHLLFNVGPFPGGGDCIIVEADTEIMTVNSNDVIHDLTAYVISRDSPS